MFPLEEMLNVDLLMDCKRQYHTTNVFGFIAYSERNPYVAKVLQDKDFWKSLNARSEGWILYAIKPDSEYFKGGNADYINDSLGLKPEEYPQLVILAIGSDQVMMQRNYPISDNSVDDAYKSIKNNVDVITAAVKRIHPNYKSATGVHREVLTALDAELASGRWKRVAKLLAKFLIDLWKG